MQRRHLRREGGNPNPTKAGSPPSLLRFLLCTPFPYPLTPTKPAFTVWLNFLFVYYIKYCFVPFTAAPLICGLAFTYRVSAVRFV